MTYSQEKFEEMEIIGGGRGRKNRKSPVRKASKSPVRKASKSPVRKAYKSPVRKASKSPVRKASKSLVRKASKSSTKGNKGAMLFAKALNKNAVKGGIDLTPFLTSLLLLGSKMALNKKKGNSFSNLFNNSTKSRKSRKFGGSSEEAQDVEGTLFEQFQNLMQETQQGGNSQQLKQGQGEQQGDQQGNQQGEQQNAQDTHQNSQKIQEGGKKHRSSRSTTKKLPVRPRSKSPKKSPAKKPVRKSPSKNPRM